MKIEHFEAALGLIPSLSAAAVATGPSRALATAKAHYPGLPWVEHYDAMRNRVDLVLNHVGGHTFDYLSLQAMTTGEILKAVKEVVAIRDRMLPGAPFTGENGWIPGWRTEHPATRLHARLHDHFPGVEWDFLVHAPTQALRIAANGASMILPEQDARSLNDAQVIAAFGIGGQPLMRTLRSADYCWSEEDLHMLTIPAERVQAHTIAGKPILVPNDIDSARRAFTDAMKADSDVAWTYLVGVAHAAQDAGSSHERAYRCAATFMRNAFDVDVTGIERWANLESGWRDAALAVNAAPRPGVKPAIAGLMVDGTGNSTMLFGSI